MFPHSTLSPILGFLVLLLLLVSIVSPAWTMYYANIDLYTMGLWSICSERNGCHPMKTLEVHMNITRSFMVLALLASFVSLTWSVQWNQLPAFKVPCRPSALVAAASSLTAGIFILIAILVFEIKINEESATVNQSKKWAFYLAYGACILCFFSGIYSLLACKFSLWEEAAPRQEEQAKEQDAPDASPL